MGDAWGWRGTTRRGLIGQAGAAAAALLAGSARAQNEIRLPFASDPRDRPITTAFPQKGAMILQRTRPPLLETPFEVFDQGVFTPNDRHYVRWHWAVIPTEIDVGTFRLAVRGHVERTLALTLDELLAMPRVELAAVNQCSGNSRGFVDPRVPGAQWANGAMGNALWMGVRLSHVLDRAGVKSGAQFVRFKGLEEPVVSDAPHFSKSLAVDHARDGEVMIAYAMNGQQLPLLNGFPLRLIVPGWYATYWVKMLSDIEVLDQPDTDFFTKDAYKIPDTPGGNMTPGQTGVAMVPINRMVPRSFVTNLKAGDTVKAGTAVAVRGIAFGGDTGVAKVELSIDKGATWQTATLAQDHGKYSFRQWNSQLTFAAAGAGEIRVRCTNASGLVQPEQPTWNPSGFMHNSIESTALTVSA